MTSTAVRPRKDGDPAARRRQVHRTYPTPPATDPETTEDQLDEALDETFPASDPVQPTPPKPRDG